MAHFKKSASMPVKYNQSLNICVVISAGEENCVKKVWGNPITSQKVCQRLIDVKQDHKPFTGHLQS